MSDETRGPDENKGAENDAHKRKMSDLFDDLDGDDDGEDTIESLSAERDDLQAKVSGYETLLTNVRADNKELIKAAQDVKDELSKTKARLGQARKESLGKFINDLQPLLTSLEENLKGFDEAKVSDPKFAKLAEGVEKTITQLSTVFSKHTPRDAAPETPVADIKNEPAANNDKPADSAEKPADTIESLIAACDALEQRTIDLGNALNRAQADQQTLTRRVADAKASLERDIARLEDEQKFGLEKCIKDLLPAVDTLDLGLQAIRKDKSGEARYGKLGDTVDATLGNLKAVFNVYGVKEINPINEAFDENKHEVITVQQRPGVDPETVVLVHQKGYEIEGRLIRPAKVIVTPSE